MRFQAIDLLHLTLVHPDDSIAAREEVFKGSKRRVLYASAVFFLGTDLLGSYEKAVLALAACRLHTHDTVKPESKRLF